MGQLPKFNFKGGWLLVIDGSYEGKGKGGGGGTLVFQKENFCHILLKIWRSYAKVKSEGIPERRKKY